MHVCSHEARPKLMLYLTWLGRACLAVPAASTLIDSWWVVELWWKAGVGHWAEMTACMGVEVRGLATH